MCELTARQISDLSFRRNVLVQALIIMDFLLSLSAKAKEKLAAAKVHNKSVMYLDQRLGDEEVPNSASLSLEFGYLPNLE